MDTYNIPHSKQKRHKKTKRSFLSLSVSLALALLSVVLFANKLTSSTDNVTYSFYPSTSAAYKQAPLEDTSTWNLVLVNKWNPIPQNYQMELTTLSNGQSVDQRIYPALQQMFDSARDEGIYPSVVSGYRTAEEQQNLLDEKVNAYVAEGYTGPEAQTLAEAWVAIPGASEHQLGIAVDINADGINSTGYEVYEWLEENAHQYGFIHRYPADKTEITGVMGEAWHYRYVGIHAATEIHIQNLCLEEYLAKAN